MKSRIIIFFFTILFFNLLNGSNLQKVTLQLQWLDQFQFAGYYIAKEKGFYKDAGIDVNIKRFDYGIDPVTEVLEKRADFGVGRSSLIIDKSAGKDIYLLSAVFQNSPLILLSLKESKIQNVKDFAGKKIMATSDAVGTASLHAMIQKNGISIDNMVLQEHSFDLNDLINGKTDLMASYISNEPFRLEQKNIAYNIFDPKDYGFDFYGDIIFTSGRLIRNDPQLVQNFKIASIKGWNYAFNNIDETVNIIYKKYNVQNKSKEMLRYEAEVLKELAYVNGINLGHIDNNKIQRIYDVYNLLGLIDQKIDIERFIFKKPKRIDTVELSKDEEIFLNKYKYIKIHNEANWPPFNFSQNGIAKGFSIDYMKLVLDKLNIEPKIVSGYSWDQYMKMLQTKNLDVIINIAKSPKRAETIFFTEPYYHTQNAIYVNKDNPNILTRDDLINKTIAMPKGFYAQKYIQKHYPEIKQILVKDSLETLKLLSLGKIDATIGKKVVMDYIISSHNIPGVFATQYIEREGFISPLRLGVAKKDKILRDILQKAQDKITNSELRALEEKWFGAKSNLQKYNLEKGLKFKEYLKKSGDIRFCIDPNLHPIEFNENGTPQGISVDIIKIIEKQLDYKFKYVKTSSFDQSLEFLKTNKCDILTSSVKTDRKKRFANFTRPYITQNLVIVTQDNKPIVSSLKSISSEKISIKKGSALISILNKNYPLIKIIQTQDAKEALEKVSKGDSYFTIASLQTFAYYKDRYNFKNLKVAGQTDLKYNISMAVRKDDIALLEILNDSLSHIQDQSMQLISEKWANQKIVKEIDYNYLKNIIIVFIIVILLIIIFLIRDNKLKRHIQEQRDTFENLYNKSTDGIFLIQNDKVIDCNESALKMLNYNTKDQFLDSNHSIHYDYLQPNGQKSDDILFDMIKKTYRSGSMVFEFMLKRRDGENFWVEIVLTRININKKDILHVALRDIDIKKNQELQLENLTKTLEQRIKVEVQKNREIDKKMLHQAKFAQMGEMISMIDHQWRQPLTAISATTSNLLFKIMMDEIDKEFFRHEIFLISKYSQHLSNTIDDFRGFFKENKNKEDTTLKQIIQNTLDIVKDALINKGIDIKVDLNNDNVIHTYKNELMQVVLNLIKNSEDALIENKIKDPCIRIESLYDNNSNILVIKDNAGGIDDQVIDSIFEPYFSTKKEKDGTGLGLYMSKIIVHEHCRGTINVDNDQEGAVFTITLKDDDER